MSKEDREEIESDRERRNKIESTDPISDTIHDPATTHNLNPNHLNQPIEATTHNFNPTIEVT